LVALKVDEYFFLEGRQISFSSACYHTASDSVTNMSAVHYYDKVLDINNFCIALIKDHDRKQLTKERVYLGL